MVNRGELYEIDYTLSKRIAFFLSYEGFARKFFQVITLTGTAIIWWIGLGIWYAVDPNHRHEAYSMFIITTIMTIAVFLAKILVKRPRPEFKDDRYFSVSFDVFSFPSGHATRAAYVSILMPLYAPELALLWYIWSLLMIVSRLVLGVHYISDIIAGLIFGSLSILLLSVLGIVPYFPGFDLIS
ncbi:MAG: phosphatase PAP2 family protein [Candidatus Kariarchaeaceae archaeon]|jgi:undecaprenyl-diphosphatase